MDKITLARLTAATRPICEVMDEDEARVLSQHVAEGKGKSHGDVREL